MKVVAGIEIKPLSDRWPSQHHPRLPLGTVVHLRSGSPLMVIVDYNVIDGRYVCAKTSGDNAEGKFSGNSLIVVKTGRRGAERT